MKFISFVYAFVFFFTYSLADSPTWTTPSSANVMAFAVNDYSHYYDHSLPSLMRSAFHKDAFIDSLFSALDLWYPGMTKNATYYGDSVATRDNYRNSLTYFTQFVFFSGHGTPQLIYLYDYPVNVSSGCGTPTCLDDQYGKIYNGATRWVIFDACLVLNVNQSDKLHLPLTVETIDFSKVDKLRSAFAGVHSILGFYAYSWDFAYWEAGQYKATEDLYEYFVYYFIEDGETIWNSFDMANADFVFEINYYYGMKPAIAFLRGYDADNNYHDTSMERFDYTFNEPIPINGTLELYVMYSEYGSPEYYSY
jgi:hypothetical protein